jgi:hypothetical protein
MRTKIKRYDDKGNPEYEQGLIICDCNDFNHSIIYWKQDYDKEKSVYLGISLYSSNNFWERIKLAWDYIFKKGRCKSMYGEILISEDNIEGLEDIVDFIKNKE